MDSNTFLLALVLLAILLDPRGRVGTRRGEQGTMLMVSRSGRSAGGGILPRMH